MGQVSREPLDQRVHDTREGRLRASGPSERGPSERGPSPKSLVEISRELSRAVSELAFSRPVAHVYNPLEYASEPHEAYLERYGAGEKEILLLGMNPGPFGMAQTGVPFGDVGWVRDWLGIEAPVDRPRSEHPKRPVLGFSCARAEISGSRLWGWAAARFGSSAAFFSRFFVVNYCPLVFLESSAKNRTPDKLPAMEQNALFAACDRALRQVVLRLAPKHVVGVGAFAAKRAQVALADAPVIVSMILHPSPANPRANQGWAQLIEDQLLQSGIVLPPQTDAQHRERR